MNGHKINKLGQQGFTIVELMIATAILSTIILLVTVMMISISNLYSKGINQARIQDSVRTVTDQLTQDLKYNGGFVVSNSVTSGTTTYSAYCIGGKIRYSYVLGHEIGSGTDQGGITKIAHVLWRDNNTDSIDIVAGSTGCQPIDVSKSNLSGDTSGIELIAPNARLSVMCIGTIDVTGKVCTPGLASPYNLSIGIAYGDADLLTGLNTGPGQQSPNLACQGTTGEQFCATSILNTIAAQRL